jgi:sec-independent protein translocase protein TatB
MSFSDTVFLFFLVLILFGPKKLPEMARQAGKLLAELRRASNEFKSQIETEISRLEVQKILPPSPPPQGTVSSLSAKAATATATTEPPRHDSLETLPPPVIDAAPLDTNSATVNSADSTPATSSNSTPTHEPAVEASVPASQEPHV